MTWAIKETKKKPELELVPDKDPTCGGLVPLYDKAALDCLEDLTKFAGGPVPLGVRMKAESMCYRKATYPVSISAEDLYYMRNEIMELRKDIAELREDVRRAIYPPAYPTYAMQISASGSPNKSWTMGKLRKP